MSGDITTILVVGASGQVGAAVMDILGRNKAFRVVGVDITPKRGVLALDMSKAREVERIFNKVRPDIVVLTAAYSHVDGNEERRNFAYKTNVGGVQHITKACKKHLAKLIFFSSAYVFDGKKGRYREEDRPHPLNYYGKTKLEAETFISRELNDYIIVRTTWIFDFGYDDRNFVIQVAKRLKRGESMSVPDDQYGNPTLASDITRALEEMILRNKKGVWNLAGPDHMNKYQWAVRVARHFKLDSSLLVPVSTKKLQQKAPRPLKGDLDTTKARKALHTPFLSLRKALMGAPSLHHLDK